MRNFRISVITLGYFLPLISLAAYSDEGSNTSTSQTSYSETGNGAAKENLNNAEMGKPPQVAEKSNENEYKERSISSCKVCDKY